MYQELEIRFKNGKTDSFSPLEDMKLGYLDNEIKMSWYGTLSIFSELIDLK